MARSTLKNLDGDTLAVNGVKYTFRLKANDPFDIQVTGRWATTAANIERTVNSNPRLGPVIAAKVTKQGIEIHAI